MGVPADAIPGASNVAGTRRVPSALLADRDRRLAILQGDWVEDFPANFGVLVKQRKQAEQPVGFIPRNRSLGLLFLDLLQGDRIAGDLRRLNCVKFHTRQQSSFFSTIERDADNDYSSSIAPARKW